ncbi:HAD family hydrolase [Tuwongella immobilis]|uniref:HAD family phosphatase n=1 Tax=Tuwongella immobilis TaxID=692036 RepID=A0A6C2YJV7_9BACT|nr:HAD family phosphatase [Tuwongella immobilis]VIP01232.1 had-superfamily subfamily variant 3 : HAD-superfamily hydrolase, subfamily IA, variant 3 OS=Desulfobacca acetoxidans (strain ATCC 700848 / DSM 11109 / ASRB2) GN=Desac_2224 PE=4 SV=1: HAD_2 [Tuwongella immobilis]VTR97890.1 had-superfamily subfamily variant 3 : HAD-superfamily hydrolase, subfamily IA, variant 3 OS=Desulfobacca acetoxidans (strain ATCC 700848 / DSM 11109 / ASRB2) GN=Desac_2224 PE=4 SV=1: HAD_2 [Tuwongella immobilis]
MIRTLVFDFGNVIGRFDHSRTVARLASRSPLAPTELALMLFGSPLNDDYETGRISTRQYLDAIRSNARLDCTDEEFHHAFVDIFQHHPPIEAVIPHLAQRYRLVLASNTNPAHFETIASMFRETLSHMHALALSHQVGHRKPHAGFYAAVQELAHANPQECLFIDDLPTNVAAAEAHGWHGIVFVDPQDLFDRFDSYGIDLPLSARNVSA